MQIIILNVFTCYSSKGIKGEVLSKGVKKTIFTIIAHRPSCQVPNPTLQLLKEKSTVDKKNPLSFLLIISIKDQ